MTATRRRAAWGATDVFIYTIKDGDGDLSTTTLTHQPDGQRDRCADRHDVTVNEKALDTTPPGPPCGGTVTGSRRVAAETDATSDQLNGRAARSR